jgi:transcriptional regulator NrdR family protein
MMSRYRQCQECKYRFKISALVETYENKNPFLPIYCPRCESNNIAVVD